MSYFAQRCLRALNLSAVKNVKTIRQVHRRAVNQTRLVSPQATISEQQPSRYFWLLLTVFAASLDEEEEAPPSFATTFQNVRPIQKVSELEALLDNAGDKLVVIFCMVRWCPFCRRIAPTVEDIAKGTQNVVMLKLDMDDQEAESSRIMARYNAYYVQQNRFAVGLPTFVLIKDGAKLEHFSSADEGRLRGAIRKYTA
ncbi:thioredoxin-like isoform X2 [Cydia fagiglandana]|uniref:thioredoxin-like isoform X2 n=1 Tax=Cydia fagiglandana TaxID=1458189 RepID=UPI002FEE587B